jgi:dTDP-4-dehydrorhamnose reductase
VAESDLLKKTVLITGGSGLLALNWALSVRDRYRVTLGLHQRNVSLEGVRSGYISLASKDKFSSTLESVDSPIVIHTAGLTDVSACERDPVSARAVNVELAEHVARACSEAGLPLVHISTDHLFAGDRALLDESHHPFPLNVYARTKAEAERRILNAHPQAVVVRTNFYGWGTSYRHSFSDFIIESLRTGKQPVLFKDVFYNPILIEDLAIAVHELVAMHARGIFNVVSDDRISKYEFGCMLAEEFGLDAGRISPGLLADRTSDVRRPLDMSLSNKKTCNLLGRKLGGVQKQIAKLHEQEKNGLAQELKKL